MESKFHPLVPYSFSSHYKRPFSTGSLFAVTSNGGTININGTREVPLWSLPLQVKTDAQKLHPPFSFNFPPFFLTLISHFVHLLEQFILPIVQFRHITLFPAKSASSRADLSTAVHHRNRSPHQSPLPHHMWHGNTYLNLKQINKLFQALVSRVKVPERSSREQRINLFTVLTSCKWKAFFRNQFSGPKVTCSFIRCRLRWRSFCSIFHLISPSLLCSKLISPRLLKWTHFLPASTVLLVTLWYILQVTSGLMTGGFIDCQMCRQNHSQLRLWAN